MPIGRIVIDDVRPRTPAGQHPAKACVGQAVRVSADIFKDGHDILAARVRWRPEAGKEWSEAPMAPTGNDRWEAVIVPTVVGMHRVVVEAWTDRFATWRHDIGVKAGAGQDVSVELEEGGLLLDALAAKVPRARREVVREAAAAVRREQCTLEVRLNAALDDALAAVVAGVPVSGDLTRSRPLPLWVDRERAVFGAWYELFPRSEGGLVGATKRLPDIAAMGFDIVYLPPIHPIGRTFRKGRDNTLEAGPDDPGSPWAIGAEEGGHTAVHPDLGTIEDFDRFVEEARSHGLEVALDYALQCSPDHPWVREHPEWFHHRPDGTIKYAENPPKKYQDIYPLNFWPDDDADREALWQACRQILEHWIDHGVRIFRVDNPHTKPLAFWEWLIPSLRAEHPDLIFLSEAFTRPKMMSKLAEVGFTQSYTYFTWRNTKQELTDYTVEVCLGPKADYMRPNFWPNTPDILSGPLRNGPPAAFRMRLLLAATLVPSYGIYSGYELCENEPASDANEEYLHSEKYEVKERDWDRPDSLAPFITRLNEVRRAHPGFARLGNIWFHGADKDEIIVYSRHDDALDDVVLCVVNLDPHHWQEATLSLDLGRLGLDGAGSYEVHDELSGQTFVWDGAHPYVRLDPAEAPGHVLHLRRAPR